MFEMMRRNTKIIMWITAGAFVLLIFLAWGAEYQIGTNGGGAQGVVGRVNGQPIHGTAYFDRVQTAREGYRQQGQTVDDATDAQIRQGAWDALIQEVLVQQEIDRLGITVTDREVVQAIRDQPLPFIAQSAEFQTDGRFDYNKYLNALRDPSRNWIQLERYYRADLPKQKLQSLVTASVKINDAEVERQYESENTKAKVAYVHLPAGRFEVDPESAGDAELRSFYEERKEDYRTGPQAWAEFVRFEKRPATIDTLNARGMIEQAQREAQEGESFDILVAAYSEAPPQLQGGETGSYLSRDQFSAPTVREAAFSLAVGEVSDILTEPNGFHLIKVLDRLTTEAGVEQAKIADIFIPIVLSPETLIEVRDRTVSFAGASREHGGDLRATAAEFPGATVTPAGPFGRSGFVPSLGRLGQIASFRDWAFNAPVGAVHTLEGPEAWYVMHLMDHRPAGIAPFAEMESRVRADYVASVQVSQAAERAAAILSRARGGTPLEEAAGSDTLATFGTTDEFSRRGFARGLGNDPELMARVFTSSAGLLPEVVTTSRGAYVLEILSRTEPEESLSAEQKETIRQQILGRRRGEVINRWLEDLRSRAEIKDYRGEIDLS